MNAPLRLRRRSSEQPSALPQRRPLAILAAAAALCSVLGPSGSTATAGPRASAEPSAKLATSGCPGSTPVWRISVRYYERASDGAVRVADAYPADLRLLQKFADKIGVISQCSVQLALDVYNMGEVAFPLSARPEDQGAPAQHRTFLAGYDDVFYVYPIVSQRPAYQGRSHGSDFFVLLPSGPEWVYDHDPVLLVHEWLHQVVDWYSEVAWPPGPDGEDAVHGLYSLGYWDRNRDCAERVDGKLVIDYACVEELSASQYRLFGDLLTGRVPYRGSERGIKPGDWIRYGLPRDRRKEPQPSVGGPGASDRPARLRIDALTVSRRSFRLRELWQGDKSVVVRFMLKGGGGNVRSKLERVRRGRRTVFVRSGISHLRPHRQQFPLSVFTGTRITPGTYRLTLSFGTSSRSVSFRVLPGR